MLNEDYKDILRCLNAEKAKFLLVGAYAMAAHGYPRSTMDIDIWVQPEEKNAELVLLALNRFGAPTHDLSRSDLIKDDTVYQIGLAPRRIDLMTGISGLAFDETYRRAVSIEIDSIDVMIISLQDLIKNKRATGRSKDLLDAENLEKLQR